MWWNGDTRRGWKVKLSERVFFGWSQWQSTKKIIDTFSPKIASHGTAHGPPCRSLISLRVLPHAPSWNITQHSHTSRHKRLWVLIDDGILDAYFAHCWFWRIRADTRHVGRNGRLLLDNRRTSRQGTPTDYRRGWLWGSPSGTSLLISLTVDDRSFYTEGTYLYIR